MGEREGVECRDGGRDGEGWEGRGRETLKCMWVYGYKSL